ncbi:MAG: EF-P lysine aminoacylase EpmA [bacterium]|nr:EF-P lysine aminoacylase EpmA [bacterium]
MSNWIDLKNNHRLHKILSERAVIIRLVREWFWGFNFTEMDTPVALKLPGQEPHLNPIPVTLHDPNGQAVNFYLQTSPEFALKKILAAGWQKIFQICKCFRDYESFGGTHNTEFTMIEWYRAPGTLADIMDDTENLFKFVAEKLNKKEIVYKNKSINITEAWERLSMKAIWQKYLSVNLDNYLDNKSIATLARAKKYTVTDDEPYEDIFYKIFLNEIEQKLGLENPIMIYDYPAVMCSLSKQSKNSGYAERFELYIGGLEIANAFGELTDAKEQNRLLTRDHSQRKAADKPTWPVDQEFISAVDAMSKNAGGIALGVDRMVLLFTDAKDINEVIFQSVYDQIS